MQRYSIEPRTREYVKGYGFLSFTRKYKKQLLGTGIDASKNAVHKAVEFIENKISYTLAKSNNNKIVKQEPDCEKRDGTFKKLRTVL